MSMLLAQSSFEEQDVMGVEANVLSEPVFSLTSIYKELVDVMTSAMAKLKLDWSVERVESAPSSMEERFLVGHKHPTPVSLSDDVISRHP